MDYIFVSKHTKGRNPLFRNTPKHVTAFAAIAVLSFFIMSVTFAFSTGIFNFAMYLSYFKSALLLLMNYIPIFFLMCLTYIIFNRLWAAFSLTGLIFFVMSLVNKFKLMYRDDPFVFADIKLVGESMIMARKYNIRLSFKMLMVLAAIIAIAIALKVFFKQRLSSVIMRLTLFSVLLLAGFLTFRYFYFNPRIYEKVGDKSLINIWIASEQFQSKGFVYPFIYSIKDAIEKPPAGYDEAEAIEVLSQYAYEDILSNQKVNIISIMLEAYNDFSEFGGVELEKDPYENFHKLQKESIYGKLVTNVFAGGTVNTERAFLTGFNTHPKYFKRTNSFVWYFKEQGYRTESMHPITGSFYNRRNVNEYLGFDSFDHYDNKYRYVQEAYLDDIYFFDYIIEGYKNCVSNGQPYFNFSVTYQNHGPYSTENLADGEYLAKKAGYDESTYNIVNNYLSGIYKTDIAIKKLVDYFRKEDEPVILILFGDHNPWMGKDHEGFDMLGVDLDLSGVNGFKNYYQTPYIIWANDEAKKVFSRDFVGEGNTISPNFLMTELFNYVGWQGNEYMQYLTDIKGRFDVVHNLYFKENGVFKKELSQENKEIWESFRTTEYYYSHKYLNSSNKPWTAAKQTTAR